MDQISSALLSVSDKTGIIEFAKKLVSMGVQLISTGGTYASLHGAGVPVKKIDEVTGFPEMLDGRVKTLHPFIHGGLLARRDLPLHMETLEAHGIGRIDMIVVNLYPFEETVASGAPYAECIEQIDIGGPAMLRSASKNHTSVTVICDPADYETVWTEIENSGGISLATRSRLALKAFSRTAAYDAAVSAYLDAQLRGDEPASLPDSLRLVSPRTHTLRYGENPHQQAALYGGFFEIFEKLHGKELSFNNIVDIQAAAALVEEFSEPAAAIIKHTNPCGCAVAATVHEAYREAFTTDPVSAFGGIIAVNRDVDAAFAQTLNEIFTEVIIAPGFSDEALAMLRKKKDRRLLLQRNRVSSTTAWDIKTVANGYLCQTVDAPEEDPASWRVVTKREPGAEERAALAFAWKVAKHVKSNAIVYTNARKTLGVGAGQMSRVDSSTIAVMKAQRADLDLRGSVVASDAFFPFADGLLAAIEAGATAVIQPGGSVRDEDVIAAADEHGIAMLFTGIRHFKH
ncbi:MAG: bifunctional phosphoribosylaminoimidazolecarboxamide formyltransferase/IMP cyclohydrolase [Ignavibacteria bacterium]|nr:bifunctional phosphoribosylaminoimidazolecarboxamide formyltransferase/IMP cyclohydrolase [Ignavibacteria bacterium]